MPVDVRDVADCHIALAASGEVRNGERFIAWSTETVDVEDVCRRIDAVLPELAFAVPPVVDQFPDRIRAREAELRAIWRGCDLRNERIRAATGVRFRPFDETLRDCVESLLSTAGVEPVRRASSAPPL
jgi:nucleoside-diphosphate-sugar epimerase